MCGIFGAFGTAAAGTREVWPDISRVLRHRGPNDEGFADGDAWALGFRRLSILDLTPSGHQPMTTVDRQHWLVFNGEIYNYKELRAGLEECGETFAGSSDSEVLLRLLARQGTNALGLLNGMFALAYVNVASRQFIIARDRLGVKPLFFRRKPGELHFASELKALLVRPGSEREVDSIALAEYLALNYLPSDRAILQGYSKLAAAHYLTGSIDRPDVASTRCYWSTSLNDDPQPRATSQTELEELSALLQDATRIRLRSDVPVGVFLSGGIDSGLVAMMASQQSDEKPLALTVSFEERSHDETPIAAATARASGLPHRCVTTDIGGLSLIDEMAWHFDEPFGDSSALATYALCREAARHATVFLSGDGGDESFGGYRRYIEAARYERIATVAEPARSAIGFAAATLPPDSRMGYWLSKIALPDHGYAAAFDALPNDPVLQAIAGDALRPHLSRAGHSLWAKWHESRGEHLLTRQQKLDLSHYLPDDVLVKVDRASMAHSIEVRSPFLDYRVVEFAARLPRGVMVAGGQGKLPLRALASRWLPEDVAGSHKRGFNVPVDEWFTRLDGQRFALHRLLSQDALRRGWWTERGVRLLLEGQRHTRRRFGGIIWRLLMLDAWARAYVDGARACLQTPSEQPEPVHA